MAVINPTTLNVCAGATQIGINGATPAALAAIVGGNPRWLNDLEVIFQNVTAGSQLWKYNTSTTALTLVDGAGQNDLRALNDVWQAWLGGSGLRTNAPIGPFASAGIGEVDTTGAQMLVDDRSLASGLSFYSSAGGSPIRQIPVLLTRPEIYFRYGIAAYQDMAGWHLTTVTTGQPVAGFASRANITNLIPFLVGSEVWVFEYDAALAELSIRSIINGNGYIVDPQGLYYNIDVRPVSSTVVRMAWEDDATFLPGTMVFLDIDITNGTTVRWTSNGTTMVSATGPTLVGAKFPTAAATPIYVPYREPIVDPKTGTVTHAWEEFFRKLNAQMAQAQTSINSLPSPTPSPSPSTGGNVLGPAASTDHALARWDGVTGRLLLDSAMGLSDAGALSFPDNIRQVFNPGANVAGLNVGAHAGDPSAPIDGDVWINSALNELRARINGSTVALGAASGNVGFANSLMLGGM